MSGQVARRLLQCGAVAWQRRASRLCYRPRIRHRVPACVLAYRQRHPPNHHWYTHGSLHLPMPKRGSKGGHIKTNPPGHPPAQPKSGPRELNETECRPAIGAMPSSLRCHRHGCGLLLVTLLLLAAAVASRGDDGTYAVSACRWQPYLCGGVNITYPFYLASDTAAVPAARDGESYCGYPGLAVACDAGDRAVLRLGDDNYTVSRIDYANLTVSLADADADATATCPSVHHNVTIPPGVRLTLLGISAVDYLFFFSGCSFGHPDTDPPAPKPKPPKPPTLKPITCGDMDRPDSMAFVLPSRDVPPGDWASACMRVFEVPVLKASMPADAGDPKWRSDGYGEALRVGFQLGWDRSSGECSQCEQSGGKCGFGGAGELLGCLCADGRVDNDGCSKILAEPSLVGT